jgi:hypothetical protein
MLDALRALGRHPVECGVHVVLWSAIVVLMATGESNGVGWFQQPAHDLWFPLIIGALWNAFTFLAAGYATRLALAARSPRPWLSGLVLTTLIVLAGKTAMHWLYIRLAEPSLAEVGFVALAGENAYSLAAFWILGSLYFLIRNAASPGTPRPERSVVVRSGHADHRLAVASIRYLKSEGNYVAFHGDGPPVLGLMTMDAAQSLLDDPRFLRVHRSYIANADHVDRVAGTTIRVGKTELPIGRTYRQTVRKRLGRGLERGSS